MACRVVCSERRNARIGIPNPCRIPSVRPPPSNRRPQGGHPCIERMRDAHGRSNVLRPLQRRFKARKKPEGYTSTPTGLKRLKTQNTAFHGNESGKGTPSGVPQPIHKRKLVLVKEEFDASSFGGPGGIRTLDLCDANAALSQLSYRPINSFDIYRLYHGMGQKSSKFSYLFSASKIYVSKNARGQHPVGSLPRSLLSPQPVSRQTPAPPQTKKLQNECSAAFGADEGT